MAKIIDFLILLCLPYGAHSQIGLTQKQYVYNHGRDTITIRNLAPEFSRVGTNPFFALCNEPKIVDSLQIDGLGKKELVFELSCNFSNSQHGGSFDIDENTAIGKYEIWNLDTKTLLFELVHCRSDSYNRFIAGQPRSQGASSYKYDMSIDRVGTITVRKVEERFDIGNTQKTGRKRKPKVAKAKIADPQEGVYRFEDGKYVKLEGR